MRHLITILFVLLGIAAFGQSNDKPKWVDGNWFLGSDPNKITSTDLTKGPVTAYDYNSSQYYLFNGSDSTWDKILNESTQISADIGEPLGIFNAVKTVTRTPIIELKSTYGISDLRDITAEVNSGTVTNDRTEYKLSTGTTANSEARLESAERGRYLPGAEGEAGIGIRFNDSTLVGDAEARWGYYDKANGFGFGSDTSGTYVFIRRDSVDEKVYQPSWNSDKLDGTGASGLELELKEGNIFQINYSWYGYGVAYFNVMIADSLGRQKMITLHRFSPTMKTSILDPNLPITAEITNGGETEDISIYVGGRQYSVYTDFDPSTRVNSHRVLEKGSIGTSFVPLVSFRRKSDFVSVAAKLEGFDIITDAPLIYQLRVNGSLTGATYTTPADLSASETAMEADSSATAITGGNVVYSGLVNASGAGSNTSGAMNLNDLLTEIPSRFPVTLCVRRVTSGTDATVSAVLRWTEEF